MEALLTCVCSPPATLPKENPALSMIVSNSFQFFSIFSNLSPTTSFAKYLASPIIPFDSSLKPPKTLYLAECLSKLFFVKNIALVAIIKIFCSIGTFVNILFCKSFSNNSSLNI